MPSRVKALMVAETVERYRDATNLIAVSYTGVSAEDAAELRRGMREKQVEIRVVRNRVTRRAFDELGLGEFGRLVDGPVAVISAEDPVGASLVLRSELLRRVAKAAVELARGKKLEVKGGWTDGKALSAAEIERLSALPPRNVLLAQIAGLAAGALRSLVGMIDAPGAALARVVRAWNEKPERSVPPEDRAGGRGEGEGEAAQTPGETGEK